MDDYKVDRLVQENSALERDKDKKMQELQIQNEIIIQLQTRQDRLEREILVRRRRK